MGSAIRISQNSFPGGHVHIYNEITIPDICHKSHVYLYVFNKSVLKVIYSYGGSL